MDRSILMSWVVILTLASCEKNDQLVNEVMEADRAFSKMSAEQGMAKAFIEYADDNVIKLNDLKYATIGKDDLVKSMNAEDFQGKLTWEPLVAKLDGDLAYTFGDWQMSAKANDRDTVFHGNYVTIWKRQANGKWKFVLDAGNPTPGPTPPELKRRIK